MPQELLLAHCLETFALSLLLQDQAPEKQGFLALGRPPLSLYASLSVPNPQPQDRRTKCSFPPVSPVGLNYNLAEPVATAPLHAHTHKKQYRAVSYPQGLHGPGRAPPYHHLMDIIRAVPTHTDSMPLRLPLATPTYPWPCNGLLSTAHELKEKDCFQVPCCACRGRGRVAEQSGCIRPPQIREASQRKGTYTSPGTQYVSPLLLNPVWAPCQMTK